MHLISTSPRYHHHHHHHHHVVLVARISLTLSRHFSLSFIASGRSSGLHSVSSHSCWMYVCAGRPAFARPYAEFHKSTSLMSSSLLLQQCPACLVRLTWIVDNILRKNQNGFRRNRSTTSQILTIRRILEGVRSKNIQATLLCVDFTKAFDSIHRGKMEQILLAYGLPKDTVAAITILYRNTKVKVRSPYGDTEYFDIVAGVLQGDTLAAYLFIICLDYVL